MTPYDAARDRAPLGQVGGWPIFASTALVAAHVAAMVVVALLGGAGVGLPALLYQREAVLHGQLWRLVTYAFLNPPSLWFAVEMYLLYAFGREIESYLGRRAFLRLYALLILGAPVALLALPGSSLAGAGAAHLCLFVAFAALYPGARIFFGFSARAVAWILVAIEALQAVSVRAWSALAVLLVGVGLTLAFVGYEQGRWTLRLPRRRPRLRVIGGEPDEPSAADVDAILDRVARHGLDSLSARERERLEQARQHLLRKD